MEEPEIIIILKIITSKLNKFNSYSLSEMKFKQVAEEINKINLWELI